MARINFISTTYFEDKFNTNIGSGDIERAINDAQFLHVLPVLGSALFDHLTAAVSASTLTAAETTLLRNYLQPMTREFTFYQVIGSKAFRVSDTGVYTNAPDKLEPLKREDVAYYRREVLTFANQLAEQVKKHIADNIADFPTYNTSNQFIDGSSEEDSWFIGIS